MKKSTNNLNESTNVMMIINNLFGLRFFEFPSGHLKRCWNLFYIVVLWIAYAGYVYHQREDQVLHSIVAAGSAILETAITFSMSFIGCYYSKSYRIFNNKLKNADESARKLGASQSVLGICSTYIFFAAWFVQPLFACAFHFQWLLKVYTFHFSLYIACAGAYGSNIISLVFLDFAICICNMKSGFKKINYLLEALTPENGLQNSDEETANGFGWKIFRRKIKKIPIPMGRLNLVASRSHSPNFVSSREALKKNEKMKHLIPAIRLIHLELCMASKMLYKMFKIQLAMQLQLGLLSIATSVIYFFVIFAFVDPISNAEIYRASIVGLMDLLFFCLQVAIIGHLSENSLQEGRKTLELIHSYSNTEGIDPETMDEIQQFSLQITQMNYGPTMISRYFRVNYKYISEYIINVTTYVLIILEINP